MRRVAVMLLLAALCAVLLPGAGQGVLPQQLGAADLLTQWGLRFDGQSALNGAGYSVSDAGDVNGDGRPDVVLGAPEASNNARTWSGSAYVVFGGASATRIDLAALGANGFRIDGAAETNRAGRAVSGAGDVNGDGRADVLVGAPFADHNGPNSGHDSGSVYVVFGKASTTTVDLAALGDGGFRIDGAAGDDEAGSAVSGVGDVNGDGRPDILVGAPFADAVGKPDSGAAHVVFGKSSTTTVDLGALGDGGFRIDGPSAGDHAGEAVSGAGDVNGDGRADLVVGAPSAAGDTSSSGVAFVVFGKVNSTAVDLAALGAGGFQIDGVATTDNAGAAVSGAGDMNGDGLMDLLVGAPEADNNGRNMSGSAYVVFGKATTANVDLAALGSGGFRIDGGAPVDRAGDAVSGAGDVNSDGRVDVLVGAIGADNNGRNSSGSAYVVFGKTSTTTVDLAQLGSGGFRIDGGASTDIAGWAVSDAADMNDDGRADVLVAARDADANVRAQSGSAYVLFGFGQPRLAYNPLQATAGQAIERHAPTLLERTGAPTFRVTPPLPAGLSIDASGAVTGTPRSGQARRTHTVTMQDLAGEVSAPLVVTVADTTAPRLTVRAASRQRAIRQKRILLRVSCDEPCTLKAQGAIVIRGSSAVVALRPANATRLATAQRTLALVLTKATQRRLSRFLSQGRKARAIVSVRARDRLGNARSNTRSIIVRR